MLYNKRILIGITGAIAAYKVCELIRMYKRENAKVSVVLTPNALNFVTKLTLQTLCQDGVYVEMFDVPEWKPEHISLTDSDIFVLAPCTANTIGKIANGIGDNLLTSTALAFKNPVLIAPSMNMNMWDNKIVQENIEKLKTHNVEVIEPEVGFLACGEEGKGRLPNLETIFNKTVQILNKKGGCLSGKKILVTAGGTKEKIDAVRYITNNSSGKMGEAVADCAFHNGADVTLITTKDVKKPYNVIKVESASDMFEEVKKADFESVFMVAAVSDFKVKNESEQKIKKNGEDGITVELVQNSDILKYLCENRKSGQKIIGFCAESENLIENAKVKIQNKGCDFLVANDISRKDIGFGCNDNEVYILNKDFEITKIEKATKKEVARRILEYVYDENDRDYEEN